MTRSLAWIASVADDLESGRIAPATAVEELLEHIDSPIAVVRERTLSTLAGAVEHDPDIAEQVIEAVADRLVAGRSLSTAELGSLARIVAVRPAAGVALVPPLTRRVASGDRLKPGDSVDDLVAARIDGDAPTAERAQCAALLGEIGSSTPGAVKRAIPTLVAIAGAASEHWTETGDDEVALEAQWALVRIAVEEPAVIRPFIAGRVWALEADDPRSITDALEDLGRLGALLPDHLVRLKRIESLLEHRSPQVRAAALRALSRICAGDHHGSAFVGRARPEWIPALIDPVTRRARDADADVRLESLRTLAAFVEYAPDDVAARLDRLAECRQAEDWHVRANVAAVCAALIDNGLSDARLERWLVNLLEDEDETVWHNAATGVRRLFTEGGPTCDDRDLADIAERLLNHAIRSTDPKVRRKDVAAAADALSWTEVEDTLEELLAADDPEDRRRGLDIAAALLECESVKPAQFSASLERMLGDEDGDVRRRAIEALGQVCADERIDPSRRARLARLLAHHAGDESEDRQAAVEALATTGEQEPEAVSSAIAFLCAVDENEAVADDSSGEMSDLVAEALAAGSGGGFDDGLPAVIERCPGTLSGLATALAYRTLAYEASTTARALFAAVAEEGTLDDQTIVELESTLSNSELLDETRAWISGTLALADTLESTTESAVDCLRSLLVRTEEGDDTARSVVMELARERSAIAARFGPSLARIPDLTLESAFRLAAADPRFALWLIESIDDAWHRGDGRSAEAVAAIGDAQGACGSTLARTLFKSSIKRSDSATIALARAVSDPSSAWHAHPIARVRRLVDTDSSTDGDGPSPETAATAEQPTVDSLVAVGLAARAERFGDARSTGKNQTPLSVLPRKQWTAVIDRGLEGETTTRIAALLTLGEVVRVVDDSPPMWEETLSGAMRSDAVAVRVAACRAISVGCGASAFEPSTFVEPLREQLSRTADDRIAALSALADITVIEPAVSSAYVADVTDALCAPDADDAVRRRAARLLGQLAVSDEIDPETSATVTVDHLEKPALGRSLALAMDAVDPASLSLDDGEYASAAERLTELVLEDAPEPAIQAGGRLLHSFVTAVESDPLRVEIVPAIRDVVSDVDDDPTSFADLEDDRPAGHDPSTDLGRYWLCQVAAVVLRRTPVAAGPLARSISATLADGCDSLSTVASRAETPRVDRTALKRSAATAAAQGGLESYVRVLEKTPPSSWPSPEITATFLLNAPSELRDDALETLRSNANATDANGPDIDGVIRSLADAPSDEPTTRIARMESIGALLPAVNDPETARVAVAVIDRSLSNDDEPDSASTIDDEAVTGERIEAVSALEAGGTSRTIEPDEAIAHLLSPLTDEDERVRVAAAEAIRSLADESYLGPQWIVTLAVSRLRSDERSVRDGGLQLLERVAVRYSSVRTDALRAIQTADGIDGAAFVRQSDLLETLADDVNEFDGRIDELEGKMNSDDESATDENESI